MRSGATLVELAVILCLLALLGAGILPAARAGANHAAVVGAREAIAALLVRTRVEALRHGGADLRIEPDGRVEITAGDSTLARFDPAAEFGVGLYTGSARPVTLRFDGLGVGRAASRTLEMSRGEARATLVIAAYGRVVRS